MTTIRAQIDALPFTAQLPEAVRNDLAAIATNPCFASGTVLCREGEPAPELFLILEGHVALDMLVPGRGQVRVLTLGPGEVLAWSALVGNQGATATGTATDRVSTIAFTEQKLAGLCQQNHDVGYFVMRELAKAVSRRLVDTRLQLLDLFQTPSTNQGEPRLPGLDSTSTGEM